jgi:hypothetical protein
LNSGLHLQRLLEQLGLGHAADINHVAALHLLFSPTLLIGDQVGGIHPVAGVIPEEHDTHLRAVSPFLLREGGFCSPLVWAFFALEVYHLSFALGKPRKRLKHDSVLSLTKPAM